MKKQAVVLLFAALLSVSMAATTSWGFNCTVTLSEQQWQCEEVISLPELTQPINFIFPNDSVIAEYGIKICLQTRVGLAHPSRWSEDSCTFYQANAPTTVPPVTAPVTTPEAAPVAVPVTAPVAAPEAAPVAAPVTAPVAVPVTEPVAEPKPAFTKRAAVNGIKNLLPSGKYVLGVAFVQPPNGNYSHTLNFGLTGQRCDATTVGSTCSYVPVTFSWNNTVGANLGVGAQDYFSAPIGTVLYGSVTIKTNSSIGLHLRRDGYPFVEENQWTSNDANSQNGELTLNNPAPGDYYIVGINNVNDTVDFSLVTSVKVCNGSANEAGPDCSQQVVSLGVADGQLLKGTASSSMSYFKLNVDGINKTRLAFSVASLDTSKPSPQVFIRWGNLPDTNNYDFVGCSTQYCAVSQVDLEVLAGSYGDWYIGVVAANGTDKDDFGIWHGAVCANNCTGDHGTCNVSGDKMGTCSCTEHFASVDCSVTVSNGLSPEMIVLIVMGALVVVSAVIGFIAWAYMRRKRGYDEIQ